MTAEEAETDPETKPFGVSSFKEAANPELPLTGTATMGRDQEHPLKLLKAVTLVAPDVEWAEVNPAPQRVSIRTENHTVYLNSYLFMCQY